MKKPDKNCNCIKETEERIRAELGAVLVQWEHSGRKSSELRVVPLRKDGQRSRVSRYLHVNWRYCPLCGKEIV